MLLRLLLISTGAVIFGSLGAFFLLIPILSIATVVVLLSGLLLMFGLGLEVGRRNSAKPELTATGRTTTFG